MGFSSYYVSPFYIIGFQRRRVCPILISITEISTIYFLMFSIPFFSGTNPLGCFSSILLFWCASTWIVSNLNIAFGWNRCRQLSWARQFTLRCETSKRLKSDPPKSGVRLSHAAFYIHIFFIIFSVCKNNFDATGNVQFSQREKKKVIKSYVTIV